MTRNHPLVSRRRRGIALLASAVPLLALAGCGGSPDFRTAAGEVREPEVFLAEVTETWRDLLEEQTGAAGQLRVEDGATCYFEYESADERLTGTVACGPVRRIDTEEGEVWDVGFVDAEAVGDRDEAVLTLVDYPPDDELPTEENGEVAPTMGPFLISQQRDLDGLVDAEGESPAGDSTSLALPDLPALPMEQVATAYSPDAPVIDELPTDDPVALLGSPGGAVALLSTAEVDRVRDEEGLWAGPPEGYTLHQVVLAQQSGEQFDADLPTSVSLVSGGGVEDLGAVEELGYGDALTRLVAVEDGGTATLELTSDGRTWALDLVTGDVAESAEQRVWQKSVTIDGVDPDLGTIGAGTLSIAGSTYDWDVTVNPFVTPYLPAQDDSEEAPGWAPDGQMWLYLYVEQNIYAPGCSFFCGSFDEREKSLVLTVDGSEVDLEETEYGGTFWALVPAETTSATLDASEKITEGDETKTVGVASATLSIG